MYELTSVQKFQCTKDVIDTLRSVIVDDVQQEAFELSVGLSSLDALVVTFSTDSPSLEITLFDSEYGFVKTQDQFFEDWDTNEDSFKMRMLAEMSSSIYDAIHKLHEVTSYSFDKLKIDPVTRQIVT